jgi:hypothetical protein
VDGQHRRRGIELVLEYLEGITRSFRYPPKKDSLYTFEGEGREVPQDEPR